MSEEGQAFDFFFITSEIEGLAPFRSSGRPHSGLKLQPEDVAADRDLLSVIPILHSGMLTDEGAQPPSGHSQLLHLLDVLSTDASGAVSVRLVAIVKSNVDEVRPHVIRSHTRFAAEVQIGSHGCD